MKKKVEVILFGLPTVMEVKVSKYKIYRGPYRYVGTDPKKSVDVFEHLETGEFVGLLS